ncbi:hypothetical protein [Adlercreutzia agrestimuris]|uniref:hypothetical protein n=1 Tax=Adlercreutzia agrestimuris TaxID=2941324 RepID=UPI00204197BC|nr:hypothetical protein [Adlercreutzia agrestimuris]
MNISANGNMCEATLVSTWSLFGEHLSGERCGIFLVISSSLLDPAARDALNSSAKSFGYGCAACTFAQIEGAHDTQLDAAALKLLVEGLDPFCIVTTDATSAQMLGDAYQVGLAPNSTSRIMGRSVVVLKSFEEQLKSAQDKQVAWALLKSLPRHTV